MSGDQSQHIERTLHYYHPHHTDCFEIRAIGTYKGRKIIDAGFFDDHVKAVDAVLSLEKVGRHDALYLTINPVDRALLGRACNRIKSMGEGDTTADKNVLLLRRLLVDVDPERPAKISSSDQEHDFAIEHAQHIKQVLVEEGWPAPVVADSGNGAHLVYRLPDLVNTPENVDLLKRVLLGLNQRFMVHRNGVTLKIDERVFNPARISKIYGTFTRKGDNTPERPHRWARLLSDAGADTVTLEQLTAIAAPAEQARQTTDRISQQSGKQRVDVPAYCQKYGIELAGIKEHGDSTLYLLRECPFDSTHRGKEAAIGQKANGALFFQCFHDSCNGRTWHDVKIKISGSDPIPLVGGGQTRTPPKPGPSDSARDELPTDWSKAIELFPPIPFPWEVFPDRMADSLNQLARACASSASSLPGAAVCLLASALGRSVAVSPKEGWSEPLIFWHADIRPSGAGKTPAARELANVLHQAQAREEARWKAEMDEWRRLPRKEKDQRDLPTRARGYFATDLTLEGLRDDLADHPTGGIVVVQDELSGFITAQNQYKAKGNDREAWLSLWDGKPARIVRKERSVYLSGGRVSLYGGIQPGVFQRVFSRDEDGLYLVDGTIFRFLLTCDGHTFHELTAEAWREDNRKTWESILERALYWAGTHPEECAVRRQILNSEAQACFLDWRNEREGLLAELPEQLRGFLPKAYSYALRLAGVLHCLHRFDAGDEPDTILTITDVQRGIHAIEFYLSQTVGALQVLEDTSHQPDALDERTLHLARVLDSLRSDVDSGRLAVSYVHERFNAGVEKQQQFKTFKAMGSFIRSLKLSMSPGKHDANGRRAANCLLWDEKTNLFIETSLQRLQRLQNVDRQSSPSADIEKTKSATSASHTPQDGATQTLQTLKKQSLQPETITWKGSTDKADIADVVSGKEEKSTTHSGARDEELFI